MRAVRPWPSPTVLLPYFAAGAFEVSRFSCMKFLGVSGVSDYAGLSSGSRLGAQYPAHLCPCLRFAVHLAVPQRKTRGRADRYSFPVRLLHSLLHAGLSRRTRIARLVHRCGAVPAHHTHQSLLQKMQSPESSGDNHHVWLLPPGPWSSTKVYSGRGSQHCYEINWFDRFHMYGNRVYHLSSVGTTRYRQALSAYQSVCKTEQTHAFLLPTLQSPAGCSPPITKYLAQKWRNFEAREPQGFPPLGVLYRSMPGRRGLKLSG